MVKALAIFLPLLGAFINAWLPGKSPKASRAASYIVLTAGFIAIIMLSIQLKRMGSSESFRFCDSDYRCRVSTSQY